MDKRGSADYLSRSSIGLVSGIGWRAYVGIGYLPGDHRNAKALRRRMTEAEARLWRLLRNRRFEEFKFRRQHPMGRYVLDFFCHRSGLVIEVDGGQHAERSQEEADQERDTWLREQGLRVLRFWNIQIMNDTETVLRAIHEALTEARPHPRPLSRRERGRG
ncbi:MAG: endonuclease domain-containing protein [Euryarchaeota archaeon]|nr:endonuclease domain-containing protein [Euryarchaeota archaeon]